MTSKTKLPSPEQLDAMRREIDEARDAMRAAIEEARPKPEIVKIFIRANHISAEAAGAEVRFRKEKKFESQNAARAIALRVDCLRGQSLKDLEKAGRRFMGRPGEGVKIGTPPPPHLIVLDDLDLGGNAGRRESQDLQLLAELTPEEFEALVADPTAPRPRSGPEKRILLLSAIRVDERTQPRAALVTDCVAEYAEAMRRGAKFPALIVFEDPEKICWLADGFHRHRAAVAVELKTIECIVYQGELRDAVLHGCGANAAHGLPRTNEDKRRVVLRLLGDEEWSHWTDSEIARRCKVGHDLVARLRKQLKPVTSGNASERTYRTKHGTTATMRTENIGRSRAPNPESKKGSSEQGPQPQSALSPQESPEPAPEPAPEAAPEPVSQEQVFSDDDALAAQDLALASKRDDAPPVPTPDPWAHQRAAFYGFIIGIKSIDFNQMIAPMPLEELREAKDVVFALSAALHAAIDRATPVEEPMSPAA
jgi:hypothetical protein